MLTRRMNAKTKRDRIKDAGGRKGDAIVYRGNKKIIRRPAGDDWF